jgi:hypothetical protein
MLIGLSSLGFPSASTALETFGLKFSSGGAHPRWGRAGMAAAGRMGTARQ